MTIRSLTPAGVTLAVAAALLLAPTAPAQACGGFFCDAQTLSPIYQAGERILFARHDDKVTMHIEVVYAGEPTQFGWILPVPEMPTDDAGNPVPLDQVVQISSQDIFTTLQNRTDPTFRVNNTFGESSCDRQFASPSAGGALDVSASDSAGDSGSEAPPVVVLQEAKVGPYNAQLIQASDSDALFDWLNDNGYFQDPKAQPLLDHYLGQDFLFLGIKLQNDATTGDMKPLALTFSESAPCVPLRLTSIAATPDMPILVWVLGQGRAVPKNFIHAVVNDQALTFPGAQNYIQVVTEAIESVTGRAWVTEYAQPAADMRGAFLSQSARNTSGIEAATTLRGLIDAVAQSGLPQSQDYQDILRDEVPMPEGLTGFPFGNCFYDRFMSPEDSENFGCEPNDTHVTTEDEFYGFLDFWATAEQEGKLTIDADVAKIAARIKAEIVKPLAGVEDLLAVDGATLTRFFTTIDPEDMTRDPLFAFNPDLPMVGLNHVVNTLVESDADCNSYVIATYEDGSKYTFDCTGGCLFGSPSVGPVPGAPALLTAEILDESGPPQPFEPSEARTVDQLLDQAVPGQRTLPANFVLPEPSRVGNPAWPNPPGTASGMGSGSVGGGPSGCQGGSLSLTLGLSLGALLALAFIGRRRERNLQPRA